jgi:acyl-CoA synthetase (AMP-forming)/AMP-acid ligase II/nucleoside-diphosphate-sugar epimerase
MMDWLFAEIERHAARVAIEPEDGPPITYAELLRATRARPVEGAIVPLEVDRGVDWVVGMLAAWQAGAAFAPLGASMPPVRRTHALRALAAAAPPLAYVMFTSGSSGTPKGVMIDGRGLQALVRAQVDAFALEPGSRALWLHAGIFDASISDVCTALASGATLVLAPAAPARPLATLASRRITHVDLPTALLPALDPARLPPDLRTVVLGGEACPPATVRAIADKVRTVVVYGPTEATVCSSLVVVDPARWSEPLIGDPLPGVRYEVVDGELWIAGDCLARGYAGDEAETARRFIVRDGVRWYRTGDRVERVVGGLAFRGRLDRQVKIGGKRIELAEIEAVIAAQPAVREVSVGIEDGRLVARVAGDVERAALDAALPAWMIPRIELVGALPRTATGKVAHMADPIESGTLKGFPNPPAMVRAEQSSAAPHAPIARELAPLWCAAIGAPSVLAGDRFRASGGDSLAAIVLAAQADARALPIAPGFLETDPSFEALVDHVRAAPLPRMTVADAEAAAAPAPAGTPDAASAATAVLVTGASGAVGSAIVEELHARGREVRCLLRGRGRKADVRAPRLGLSDAELEGVGLIIHGAALVNLGLGWDALAPTNVAGTANVAALAIPWHHVSTLAVFVGTDRATGRHAPADVPAPDAIVHGDYAATKIAAEAIARRAARSISRLGLIVGAPRGQLAMVMRGLARLGAVPRAPDALRFDTTPLAHAARRVVDIALGARGVHHVASARGAHMADLARALRGAGADVVELTPEAWADRARARFADPDVAMAYLSLARIHAPERTRLRAYDLFLATGADFCDRAPEADLVAAAREALA